MEDKYYIQDKSRGYSGNSMVWWKHNNCGYVCDIQKARIWSKKEAEQMCRQGDDLVMWPKEYIDERIQHHIDMQLCDIKETV